MKMLQAKIRGLGDTIESGWFETGPRLNVFHFKERSSGGRFLKALQTINPPYSCQAERPFSNFPHFTTQRGYMRRLSPKKRTVAMAVFSATPEIVNELAVHSELLYETDRIEVGRRLDYSQWINFVELASSSRWSEAAPSIQELVQDSGARIPQISEQLQSILETTKPYERIKRELKEGVVQLLTAAQKELGPEHQRAIDHILTIARRFEYFQRARTTVRQRLPLFITLGSATLSLPAHNLLQWAVRTAAQQSTEASRSAGHVIQSINSELAALSANSPMKLQVEQHNSRFRLLDSQGNETGIPDHDLTVNHMYHLAYLAIAVSRAAFNTDPILLFDAPEESLPQDLYSELAAMLAFLTRNCQCIYVSRNRDLLPESLIDRWYDEAALVAQKRLSTPQATR